MSGSKRSKSLNELLGTKMKGKSSTKSERGMRTALASSNSLPTYSKAILKRDLKINNRLQMKTRTGKQSRVIKNKPKSANGKAPKPKPKPKSKVQSTQKRTTVKDVRKAIANFKKKRDIFSVKSK